jgi:general secretion pathway protein I
MVTSAELPPYGGNTARLQVTARHPKCMPIKNRISGTAVFLQIAVLPQTRVAASVTRARPRRQCATRSSPGFTLIEVVVALALVAISLTAIGAVATTSARGTRSLEQHLALVETTRMVAATLPKDDQAPLDGLSGEILGHRWRISVAPFVGSGINQIPDSPWIPQTVVVRVRSPSGAVYGFETVRLLRRPVQ